MESMSVAQVMPYRSALEPLASLQAVTDEECLNATRQALVTASEYPLSIAGA